MKPETIIRKRLVSILMVITMICSGVFAPSAGQVQTARAAESDETGEDEEDYVEITNVSELYAIRNNLKGKYRLMNDIDLTEATAEGGEVNNTGHGWDPIDDFSGVLDGNGHVIKGMKIYGEVASGESAYYKKIGLFGCVRNGACVRNLGMVDVDIDINAYSDCGALVGAIDGNYNDESGVEIQSCFATGVIKTTGCSTVGGLIGGYSEYGYAQISNCYNSIDIEAINTDGNYATNVGGIAGEWSYYYSNHTKVEKCYNIGNINDGVGEGIAGNYRVTDSYYLMKTAAENSDGTPLTETQMKNPNYFIGWDFDDVWEIDPYSNYKYPQLKSCRQKRVKSLEIATPPAKTEYNQGEPLDITGATVKVIYEDGLETTIFLTEDMLGDYDMTAVGKQQIPVNKANATTSLEVNVNGIPVTGVAINKTSTSIYKGYTEQLSASVIPETATYKGIEWLSDDETIATVGQDGTITGKNPGTVTIRATSQNGVMAECQVTVTVPSVILQLDAYDITINKGDTYVPTYKLSPVDSTDTVKWTSSDEAIVHIDDKNQLIGVDAGVVTVTGVTESGVSAVCTVTVMQDLSEFTVLDIKDMEYTGTALTQTPTVTNGTKTLRAGVDYSVEYSSNVNVGKATVKIIGLSPYKGTLTKQFNILPASEGTIQTGNQGGTSVQSEPGSQTSATVTTMDLPKVTISSIKASKKKLVVKWKRVQNASGYKIEVAKNRAFTKGKKTYTVGKNTLKKTLKGAKKTTYYVRVQTYAYDENGQISFGGYSSIKKKKTK